jgi:sortase A
VGESYCTLITCTPIGINTHRLLVRGKFLSSEPYYPNVSNGEADNNTETAASSILLFMAAMALAGKLVVGAFTMRHRRKAVIS